MKRLVLLLFIGANSVFAQNIDEQKVAFKYEQKPLYVIDKGMPYTIEVDLEKYAQKSDDSLVRYEYVMNQFEQSYNDWYIQKQKIDKSYLLEMSAWEKGKVANPTLPQPIKQAYPPQPFKEDVEFPVLLAELNQTIIENGIQLEGFNKGDGGIRLLYLPEGLEQVKLEKKEKTTGTTRSIEYTLRYTSPYTIKAVLPNGEEVFSHKGGMGMRSYKIGKFDTEYDYEYWKIDHYNNMWPTVQQAAINSNLSEANQRLNDHLGYPIKSYGLDIYTVKKHKGMDYSDFIQAYTIAKQGYLSVPKESQKYVTAQLAKAISIWKEAEKESYIQDKKARVNKKVTAIVYMNLANAYLWSKDFNQADYYIQKTISLGVYKYKNAAQRLQRVVDSMRKRHHD
ncbi:MAG: hypothetical protein N4A35_04080 [Flavobacteriales bacterium]|jgi:uncharacterized protein YktB (UPF0637 family)|nr:hypothetical protein [Flavobacteriales bacterium]